MTLKLVNNLTKTEYNFTKLEDKRTSRLFWNFDILLQSGMPDGEYSYTLTFDDGFVEATGLLQIGDYVPNNNAYTATTQSGGFVQYNGSI